jgi:DNA-binding MarR family transcriptional regulator
MSSSASERADAASSTQPSTRVLRQFRVVFNSVKTHFRQVEREAGLGGAQLWALSVIQRRPGIGVTELARELDIHQSTASNLIKALVERGLVETSRHGVDRRSVPCASGRAAKRCCAAPRCPLPGCCRTRWPASMRKRWTGWNGPRQADRPARSGRNQRQGAAVPDVAFPYGLARAEALAARRRRWPRATPSDSKAIAQEGRVAADMRFAVQRIERAAAAERRGVRFDAGAASS